MQTVIRLTASEMNNDFLLKIKDFLQGKSSAEITITINDEEDYSKILQRSVDDAENNRNMISFTMEEFVNYKTVKSVN